MPALPCTDINHAFKRVGAHLATILKLVVLFYLTLFHLVKIFTDMLESHFSRDMVMYNLYPIFAVQLCTPHIPKLLPA